MRYDPNKILLIVIFSGAIIIGSAVILNIDLGDNFNYELYAELDKEWVTVTPSVTTTYTPTASATPTKTVTPTPAITHTPAPRRQTIPQVRPY